MLISRRRCGSSPTRKNSPRMRSGTTPRASRSSGPSRNSVMMRSPASSTGQQPHLPRPELLSLLYHDAYEPRMAAFCVLDFQARGALSDGDRADRARLYLDRHDAITTYRTHAHRRLERSGLERFSLLAAPTRAPGERGRIGERGPERGTHPGAEAHRD